MLHHNQLFAQLQSDQPLDQFHVQAGNIIISNAGFQSDFNQKELPNFYNQIEQQKRRQQLRQRQNEKERKKLVQKLKPKDLSLRVFKILATTLKKQNYHLVKNTLKALKINQSYVNIKQLGKIYQQPELRPMIAQAFLSGSFRRLILQGRRRSSICGQNKNSNNLLKQAIFETFAFIQGGTYCRSSLKQPILATQESINK